MINKTIEKQNNIRKSFFLLYCFEFKLKFQMANPNLILLRQRGTQNIIKRSKTIENMKKLLIFIYWQRKATKYIVKAKSSISKRMAFCVLALIV